MRNKSCGNGSKICVPFRNAMRNGIAIGNPMYYLVNVYINIKLSSFLVSILVNNIYAIVLLCSDSSAGIENLNLFRIQIHGLSFLRQRFLTF